MRPEKKVAEDQASYLGIYGEDVTDAVESSYGIPKGIYVSSLVENGPAAQAGLPTGLRHHEVRRHDSQHNV